jgi:hypothetical protein
MSTPTPELSTLVAGLYKHGEMLAAAVAMETPGNAAETDTAVRQMLQRASDLVRAAGALGEQRNPTALGVLSRAILENLILLLWVQVAEENADILKQTALAELARAARVNFEKGKARVLNRHTGEDATDEFMQSDRFKNPGKRASVESRAKEAGVEDLYTVFYRFMSLDMHGHRLAHKSESPEAVAVIHLQGIGALAAASGHVGVRWLVHRQRTDNESLRGLLGIGRQSPNLSSQPTASGGG